MIYDAGYHLCVILIVHREITKLNSETSVGVCCKIIQRLEVRV